MHKWLSGISRGLGGSADRFAESISPADCSNGESPSEGRWSLKIERSELRLTTLWLKKLSKIYDESPHFAEKIMTSAMQYRVPATWITVDLPMGRVCYELKPDGSLKHRARGGRPVPHHVEIWSDEQPSGCTDDACYPSECAIGFVPR
jgi:hypothetical protein